MREAGVPRPVLRVLAMTCPGRRQDSLVGRLASEHELVARVVVSAATSTVSWRGRFVRLRSPATAAIHLAARRMHSRRLAAIEEAEQRLFPLEGSADGRRLDVQDVNDPACIALLEELAPDVVVVNGTNLLRSELLAALAKRSRFGVVNVHTGLSPYSRGGNCNLHVVLHGQPQLVGVTVHHIDAGIDSGDIILSGRPDLMPDDTMEIIEARTFRLGWDLLLVALKDLATGGAPRVRQWTPGMLFLRRTGYDYRPDLWAIANDRLGNEGLIRQYRAHRRNYDEGVRVVTSALSRALLPDPGFAECG